MLRAGPHILYFTHSFSRLTTVAFHATCLGQIVIGLYSFAILSLLYSVGSLNHDDTCWIRLERGVVELHGWTISLLLRRSSLRRSVESIIWFEVRFVRRLTPLPSSLDSTWLDNRSLIPIQNRKLHQRVCAMIPQLKKMIMGKFYTTAMLPMFGGDSHSGNPSNNIYIFF